MQKSWLIWFTGLSGAGKSTLSLALREHLQTRNTSSVLLDGDLLRHTLCKDLGYSAEDRTENVRRAAEVGKIILNSGVPVIAAFMSPLRAQREMAKEIIGPEQFIEIYCRCSLKTCQARDVKGLYKRANAEGLKNMVGMDAVYEEPLGADLIVDTEALSISESVQQIFKTLSNRGFVHP